MEWTQGKTRIFFEAEDVLKITFAVLGDKRAATKFFLYKQDHCRFKVTHL